MRSGKKDAARSSSAGKRDLGAEEIRSWCAERGFPLSRTEADGLALYLSLLCKWNRVMNLVGPSDPAAVLRDLVADSLHLADFLRELSLPEAPETWDLGAGAGLPGIPLRLLWRRGSYTLIEARDRRSAFLQTVLAVCPLPGVRVYRGRAEAFLAGHFSADLVLSRAFMPWEQVLALVSGHIAPRGCCLFLALTPAPPPPEGWSLLAQRAYAAGANDRRHFWVFTPDTVFE
ncbi:MAG: 16S rRNA (guanine(527)-N(7))-methyltransferase RsmG [Desulfovibrio sp.]|jgi:16S rRNA (guanine527-N7)-methyltransferase|nr:16S rRNA (guanine(527)-N(7))-methyltransferase RsmG [Desulfovibrio sp.]